MIKRLLKPSRLLALGSALSLLLSLAALAAPEGGTKLTVTAGPLEEDHMTVTVALRDVTFNVTQFYLEYDPACLEPRNIYQGGAATNALFMTEYAEPFYNVSSNPDGWLSSTSSVSLDSAGHTLRCVLQVEPASAGQASNSEGYYTAEEPEEVLKLHFTVTDTSKLYTNSLRLGRSDGVPSGVIIANGEPQGLTDPSLVRIDLTAAGAVEEPTVTSSPIPTTSVSPSASPSDEPTAQPSSSPSASTAPSPDMPSSGGDSGGGHSGGDGDKVPEPEPPATPAPTTPAPVETPASNGETSVSFSDTEGNWAEESILALAKAGYINGKPGGIFAPDDSVSRAEFAVLLTRMMKVEGEPDSIFADTQGHWAQSAINAAYSHGFVSGGGDGFAPDRSITRQELVVILQRALQLAGSGRQQIFTDDDQIAPWAKSAVYAVREAGYITGYPDGSFGPERAITRAEMAHIMAMLLK